MLVLSRGRNDKVVFPTLGVTVEILRVDGGRVRVGVDAPRDVPVLRGEVEPRRSGASDPSQDVRARAHEARNRMHKATLSLRLLQRTLEAQDRSDAELLVFQALNELKALELEFSPGSAPAPSVAGSGRALLVEDDQNECELLAGYLRLSGFQVDTACDGMQAMVQLARIDRPHVVLLDMKMPRLDGRKTVEEIRKRDDYHDLKIFAVTGAAQEEADVRVGEGGVDRWFRKPVDPFELVQAIHQELADKMASA